MVGLSTSQQMNLKASTRTHPKVFELTDSESCENLQLTAVLPAHAATRDANVDGWLDVLPLATEQRQGHNLLPLNRPTEFQGRRIDPSGGGTCRLSRVVRNFLPVAHPGGDAAGAARQRHVWPFVLVRLTSCNSMYLPRSHQLGGIQQ